MTDEATATMVDGVLDIEDINNDGYVEYAEFVTAYRRAEHMRKADMESTQEDGAPQN